MVPSWGQYNLARLPLAFPVNPEDVGRPTSPQHDRHVFDGMCPLLVFRARYSDGFEEVMEVLAAAANGIPDLAILRGSRPAPCSLVGMPCSTGDTVYALGCSPAAGSTPCCLMNKGVVSSSRAGITPAADVHTFLLQSGQPGLASSLPSIQGAEPLKYINGASAELRANQRGQRAAVVVGAGGAGRAKRIYPCKYCGHVHSRYHGKCQQVLGGGVVPGALVLLGGDPGVGKSTITLQVRPDAVVMDSINTVYLGSLPQAPGTVTQIRECGQLLLRLAKDHRIALFIIGHSALFLESRMADAEGGADGADDLAASSVVGVTMQGSRAILVEVQALVSPLGERAAAAASALSYRSATGVDKGRLATLCAILDKHVPTLELANCSVIVNVVRDVASDLAIAVAVAASYYNVAVPRDLAVCGERLDVRVREAAKLGFRRVVIPRTKGWERLVSDGQLAAAGVEVVAVRTVAEALLAGLGAGTADHRPPHVKPPARGKPPPGRGGVASAVMVAGVSADGADEDALEGMSLRQRRKGRRPAGK
eukprot:XP_001700819.1 predicted protein [Chlamydomonas reinhardtii]